jgi:2-keto-4-pentenoate hydratase/2-oxohepta-3-ene-1,7-dioic acid hydratase in catechol pathway
MRLVTFSDRKRGTKPGVLVGEEIVDISDQVADIRSLIEEGQDALGRVRKFLYSTTNRIPLAQVELLAPLQNPPRIFCVGLAYRDHAIETHQEIPKVPTIFLKLTSALMGPRSTVVLPKLTKQPDYEAEFAFVIGMGGKNISADTWEEHVFGYTIMNDVSARDVQMATTQWSLGKSFDTFAPLGPAIVTKDEVPDPHALDIRLTIGGEVLQHSEYARVDLSSTRPDRTPLSGYPSRGWRHRQYGNARGRWTWTHSSSLAASWGDHRHRGGRPRAVS